MQQVLNAARTPRSAAEKEAARAFEAAARDTVRNLSGRFAWKTAVTLLAILAALGTVDTLTLIGWLSYWAAIPVNAILFYLIFTPLHEGVHGNIAGSTRAGRAIELIVGHISGYLLEAPFPGYRVLHLHHHQHTNDPVEDPDYWVRSNNYLSVILRCMAIQPVYIFRLWQLGRNNPVAMRAFICEMLYIASYPAIAVAAFAIGWGPQVLLLWLLPAYIGVVLCPLMFDWPVHHPHANRGRYNDSAILLFPRPLQTAMDLAFCGHTYHLMHHMYPRIPFYDYGTAWYALEPELRGMGVMVRKFDFGGHRAQRAAA